MNEKTGIDFGKEVAKLLPGLIREVTREQASILARGGLTIPQVVILDFLRDKGSCRMGNLARTLNMTMSAATSIVDKMIKSGFLKRERSKSDRRVVMVRLRDKGRSIANQVNNERRKMTNELFAVITESEKREYLRILTKVCEGIRKR